jgi:hypothetical protein
MRGVALAAPVIVLALVHLLQRLEVWASDTGQRTTRRLQAVGPLDSERAGPSLRQTPVPRRRPEGEASDHG